MCVHIFSVRSIIVFRLFKAINYMHFFRVGLVWFIYINIFIFSCTLQPGWFSFLCSFEFVSMGYLCKIQKHCKHQINLNLYCVHISLGIFSSLDLKKSRKEREGERWTNWVGSVECVYLFKSLPILMNTFQTYVK